MPTFNQVSTKVKIYKALLAQNAPVASQTSGTVPVGSIWTITTYMQTISGVNINYTDGEIPIVGDTMNGNGGQTGLISSVTSEMDGTTSVTFSSSTGDWSTATSYVSSTGSGPVNHVIYTGDNFSNWTLLSGSANTTGAVYKATTSAPTDWSYGSDISYDGAPYVVSINANGVLGPIINTIGDIVWSYDGPGYFIGTLAGAFPEGKTILTPGNEPTFGELTLTIAALARGDDNQIYLNNQRFIANTVTGAITQTDPVDNMITTSITIEVLA